ncbi:hypothetical protein [Stieleria mannarensis]|uniref:hypothetical protein n=1 Tax=Stieleria mannarensis TaxID=2755585 RepID=UPI0015FFED5C|nr:hypothetical protein [Rhodopirellula sp. JC639]
MHEHNSCSHSDLAETPKAARLSPTTRRPRHRTRGGYLYVAVLFTALIVAGSVATAISLDTARIKTLSAATDRQSAIRLAESELHRVSVQLSENPNWRDDLTNGQTSVWIDYATIAGSANAAARYRVSDVDGDLADDVFDEIEVVAHARFGSAQAAVSVMMQTGFAPLDWLRYGVTTFDDLHCDNGATLVSERPVQVFDDCKTGSGGDLTTSTLECSGAIQFPVRGDISGGNVQRPTFDVAGRYQLAGTEIPLESLTYSGGLRAVHATVLSSASNPYGPADPDGIYWIDAQGQSIRIADARIVATLAIQNANRVYVNGALSWEAPGQSGAILVTDGEIEFDVIESTLSETTQGVNFNPPSTPYRGTDSNLTISDRFPTEFRGIVYTSNNLFVRPTVDGEPLAITGLVMCHDLRLYHSLFVRSYDEVLTDVPLGFADPRPLRFKSGTFRRVDTL